MIWSNLDITHKLWWSYDLEWFKVIWILWVTLTFKRIKKTKIFETFSTRFRSGKISHFWKNNTYRARFLCKNNYFFGCIFYIFFSFYCAHTPKLYTTPSIKPICEIVDRECYGSQSDATVVIRRKTDIWNNSCWFFCIE